MENQIAALKLFGIYVEPNETAGEPYMVWDDWSHQEKSTLELCIQYGTEWLERQIRDGIWATRLTKEMAESIKTLFPEEKVADLFACCAWG